MHREGSGYRLGEAGYQRISLAVGAAGMTALIAMYATQAVLPEISAEFGATPAAAALTVSATTGMLALMVIPASVLSERFGRLQVMVTCALIAAVIGLILAWVPSLEALVILRGAQGAALAGVPATAMAYLAEEVHPDHLGSAMGRYIAGTTLGGLMGRLLPSFTLNVQTWRWGLTASALAALVFALALAWLAPASRRFRPRAIGWRTTVRNLLKHLRTGVLAALFATGFLLMGAFVSVYNFVGYRLSAAPFTLPVAVVGLVFLMYLSGTLTSALSGRMADRYGRGRTLVAGETVMLLGLVLTWPDQLALVLLGLLLFTAGFFAAHSVASGWVGQVATEHRAEATSLYLFAYYTGSSLVGAGSGLAYAVLGWGGLALSLGVLIGIAGALACWCATSRNDLAVAALSSGR